MGKRKREDESPDAAQLQRDQELSVYEGLASEYLESPQHFEDEMKRMGFGPQKKPRARALSDPLCHAAGRLVARDEKMPEMPMSPLLRRVSPSAVPDDPTTPVPKKKMPKPENPWFAYPFDPNEIAERMSEILYQVDKKMKVSDNSDPQIFRDLARKAVKNGGSELRRMSKGLQELREFLDIGPMEWDLVSQMSSKFFVDVHVYIDNIRYYMERLFPQDGCRWLLEQALDPLLGILSAVKVLWTERQEFKARSYDELMMRAEDAEVGNAGKGKVED